MRSSFLNKINFGFKKWTNLKTELFCPYRVRHPHCHFQIGMVKKRHSVSSLERHMEISSTRHNMLDLMTWKYTGRRAQRESVGMMRWRLLRSTECSQLKPKYKWMSSVDSGRILILANDYAITYFLWFYFYYNFSLQRTLFEWLYLCSRQAYWCQ